jgi:NAD(P)-dependent dehydrogenase (short-subunit alcohol dehydrogenase family)
MKPHERVAIVAGASRGIGAAIAASPGAEGATVVVSSHAADPPDVVDVEELRDRAYATRVRVADVLNEEGVPRPASTSPGSRGACARRPTDCL